MYVVTGADPLLAQPLQCVGVVRLLVQEAPLELADVPLPLIGVEGPTLMSGSGDRKSTRLNSSHLVISYAVFCLKKKKLRPLPSNHRASAAERGHAIRRYGHARERPRASLSRRGLTRVVATFRNMRAVIALLRTV